MTTVAVSTKVLREHYELLKLVAKDMAFALAACYPVGTILEVAHTTEDGVETSRAVVEVICKPSWYLNPYMLRCRYLSGKKVRDFLFEHVLEVIERPIVEEI